MPARKKVLVAEDDPAILEVIKIILEEEGYQVITAQESGAVQEKIKRELPSLILLDIWMSGQDGRDVAKFLRQEQTTKHIPIIMISAHNATPAIAKEVGANDFLTKPFDINDLQAMVKKYIQ